MPGTLERLPAIGIEGHRSSGLGSVEHPMRVMTRRAAGLVGPPWDDRARAEVGAFFDALAEEWHTRTGPERAAVVADALDRGLTPQFVSKAAEDRPGATQRAGAGSAGRADVCVELGSGIGAYTPALAARWGRVLAVDVALEMLLRAPAGPGHRVLADGARLPLADGTASAVVLVNCFLFPGEVDRVLGADGVVVWVNSSGSETPIHLTADEVLAALPGTWAGVSSGAGQGLWSVFRRA